MANSPLIWGGGTIGKCLSANGSAGQFVATDGNGNWGYTSAFSGLLPTTIQAFTSGSGTYTVPSSAPLYIKIKMVGGGGGGSESGNAPSSTATAGGSTTFGTSLLTAGGGAQGVWGTGTLSAGGTNTINSPAIQVESVVGAAGGGAGQTAGSISVNLAGGYGASSLFGGAGPGGCAVGGSYNGGSAATNSGSGGGGAGQPGAAPVCYAGQGGAAGGYLVAQINSPIAGSTYSYAIGAGGTGGTAGSNGYAGGNGGSGYIIVEEYYGGSGNGANVFYALTNRTITSSFTVDSLGTDYVVLCNASSAITVTLPTPSAGRSLIIKDISGAAFTNNITIARHASELIENVAASKVMQGNYDSWGFVCDGTNWWLI